MAAGFPREPAKFPILDIFARQAHIARARKAGYLALFNMMFRNRFK